MIKKAVKKPIPVEFIKFEYNEKCIEELIKFMGLSFGKLYKGRSINSLAELQVLTLEDEEYFKVAHIAFEGDYIIKGNFGEFFPIKAKIFEATYEVLE